MSGGGGGTGLEARLVARRSAAFGIDLPLAIPPGRTLALLGPNGAGKSTAVAVLAGLLPLESGFIRLDGLTFDDPAAGRFVAPEARRVGVVFQDYLLFDHMSVAENVEFGLRSRGTPRSEARRRAMAWIDRLGLAGMADRRPNHLSGGQAQRVALARALATDPLMLLLDEPLAALDISTRVELRRTLAEHLAAFAGPRLLITHDPTEAFLLADEVGVIEDGRLTQAGTVEEVRGRPRTPYVADLSGANLVSGAAADGVIDTGTHRLNIADHLVRGPVLAVIRATAIAVHLQRPEGSPRNAWPTVVEGVEHLGDRARLRVGEPLPLTVEITDAAARAMDLDRGRRIWVSLKATEIDVEPA